MNIEVQQFKPEEWKKISKEIHTYVFNEIPVDGLETIDFALMVLKDGKPAAYCTCILFDSMSVYMQHGGALPDWRGTTNIAKGYFLLIEWLEQRYSRITTKIENTNVPMFKLALSAGFIPNGMYMHHDKKIFVNMINERTL